MTLLTSPTILPKKTQKPLCVKQFSNPSGSILLNSSLSSTSPFYSSSPFSSSRFSYSLFSSSPSYSSPSYSSPSSNPLTLLTLGDQVFTNSLLTNKLKPKKAMELIFNCSNFLGITDIISNDISNKKI